MAGEISQTRYSTSSSMTTSTNTVFASYSLTQNDMVTLVSNPISIIRIETSTGNVDFDIKMKKSDLIGNEIKLVQQLK